VRSLRAPTFLDHRLPDIQIDPKQDQRPEKDRQEGRADALQALDAVEVVITTGDEGADDHIDEREQAATEAHIPTLFHDLRASQGTSAVIPGGNHQSEQPTHNGCHDNCDPSQCRREALCSG
jgi:hypothetical protein